MFDQIKHVHFIGIGGIGMSALARILCGWGVQVSGSDVVMSKVTAGLAELGATIYQGHAAENLAADVDLLVYSSVINEENPEYAEAKRRGVRIICRAELLAELLAFRSGILVAGAHGKTTTTGMLGTALLHMAQSPTIVVGGILSTIGTNSCWGAGEYMVAEADESDGSFLLLPARLAVVTNIENDHLDHYGSMENLVAAFRQFINQLPAEGRAVLGLDCPILAGMLPELTGDYVTFALHNDQADYQAKNLRFIGAGSLAEVWHHGELLGEIELAVPGEYNMQNALAAMAALHSLGFGFADIAAGLAAFRGTGRRFECLGADTARDIAVYDDYAHHPSEIRALLAGARNLPSSRLVVVFQPHRYSRTQLLFDEFAAAFDAADVLVLNEIYPAFEAPIPGVSSLALADAIRAHSSSLPVYYAETEEDVLHTLDELVQDGDLVLIAGAGNIRHTGEVYAAKIRG
ncbi:MAG: UDP-N-acetylmuramate--L-alanine ligase [Firmicutes bacterium]|nr:UDP-N-acetylmuramate--L-alanine ligase [Bacillota bacterium]